MTENANDFSGTAYKQPVHPELGALEVCKYPDRKQVSLGMQRGNTTHALAYFRSEEAAREFMAWMGGVVGKVGE